MLGPVVLGALLSTIAVVASDAAPDFVQALLDRSTRVHGAGADERDHNGATPLIHAAGLGNTAVVELLLRKGARIDAADAFGMTALHRAAEGGMLNACKLLLARGARRDARDALSLTPAEVAHAWGYPKVAELLGHPAPWSGTSTSAGRGPPFNADGTEAPANPRWRREL
jgi:ankyrin repeat protein